MTTTKFLLVSLLIGQLFLSGCKNESPANPETVATSQDSIPQSKPTQDAVNPETPLADDTYENDNDNGGEACFEKSDFGLPYDQTLDPSKAKYKILPCEVQGVEDFLCNSRGLRYIALPKFQDVDVVLVPMDCGDFKYRYVLLTIVHKNVVANQYVEGEWYEPGDESYKELTKFSIDKNYKISVVTNSVENGKTALKEKLDFQLLASGKLQKL
ncbi:hypothetical protein [Flavobacterium sp.]|uniref:hypothetical protein n=1 Tax=Flavobacterium sp. TaxID=239 RepID=UPI0012276DE2|nr:hypothetical protein [Flavobacterium sp.]RZJ70729.1 MAG: hypothetical protein EOO49_12820 [Flavobacterium sp.]